MRCKWISFGSLLATTLFCFLSLHAEQIASTSIKLDADTFTPRQRELFTPLAKRVSTILDKLIPGVPEGYPRDGVFCFIAPERWNQQEYIKAGYSPPPVTIWAGKAFDEPKYSPADTERIALSNVVTEDEGEFAFELSHELTHVKLGSATDNYLDETLAVAVSLEVLSELGFSKKIQQVRAMYIPAKVKNQIDFNQWDSIRESWLDVIKHGDAKVLTTDRAFQFTGASILLNDRKIKWRGLLNLGRQNYCSEGSSNRVFQVCAPDLTMMRKIKLIRKDLGIR